MPRKVLLWFSCVISAMALIIVILGYLLITGERGLFTGAPPKRSLDISRLDDDQTKRLGWAPDRLDAVYDYAATLSSDTLLIVTRTKTVRAFGKLDKLHATHSVRKALLSAVVGQNTGSGPNQIDLDATLQDLKIDDTPMPLGALQKQATVRHLLMSVSGINHPAAAEGGLTAEKNQRLGQTENRPGTVWAYNNWDYNALTSIFEMRTGMGVAQAFHEGIAIQAGMKDFTPSAVSYIHQPSRSQHKAAAFRMSARDLVIFGQLFLENGKVEDQQILPASWRDRIVQEYTETGRDDLRWGHGYLWWLPSPKLNFPEGAFWAWGLGNQAVFVIPAWDTVIVHQADTTEFRKRFIPLISDDSKSGDAALEEMILSCRKRANRESEYCVEHRFVTRREFAKLMSLIVEARQ
ncbi:MAG: beta-lactamase family protein [Hyphomicrobiales bacterium]|nr:beta-lactamase family protein [Hyphomicrobiales bacterium]